MKEKVTIVIPVYNGSNYMRCAIDSALAQTYENIEIIVINDGSTDNGETESIAKSYGERIRYYYKENGGVATAVNMGIELMTGEYFAWLAHDDMFEPTKIEKQMEAIHKAGLQKAICHCNFKFLYVENNKEVNVNWLEQYERDQLENSCFATVFLALHSSTILIHKSHFERVGNFKPELLATQDSDMYFRLMRGQRSVFVEECLATCRVHKEQGQQTMKCHREEFNRLFFNFCEDLTSDEKIDFCGSEANFYNKLYALIKYAKPSDEIIPYLEEKIVRGNNKIIDNKAKWINTFGTNEVWIFGAGQMGGELYEILSQNKVKVTGYIDNDVNKWGCTKCGLRIESPQYLTGIQKKTVIIAMMDPSEVGEQLQRMNIVDYITIGQVKKFFWRM